ncbi:ABC transporter ATP-binding protein [Azohydromonas caseinilytica]|uniref:ABC transporter ATP-binding protein n=1 Tax=Azohydromonas caseinilytica TaxID=2728836 RepID=A0A848F4C9_9BURK|nr:ABC transporter ATP-binding protein [Azohydromonas caseinilytica]NML14927.1 ABC transporter ATP-binding protein [Azohydromonas caseinilytica]
MSALLEAQGLALRAGERTLLANFDLRIEPGQCWALLGPNGSGKSTLLHTLAGLRPAQGGQVRLEGRPLAQWPPLEAARRRGLLPQQLHDAFAAPVLDVVLTGRHPHLPRWGWEGEDDRRIARAALAAVDLYGFEARDVRGLSGGERQRVGIAALLAQAPRLLMLDEPLAHLDLPHQVAVLAHLRALAQREERAVLLSIHDLNLAHRFATHALLLGRPGVAPRAGAADAVMSAAALSEAFGHRVRRGELQGRTVFVAD